MQPTSLKKGYVSLVEQACAGVPVFRDSYQQFHQNEFNRHKECNQNRQRVPKLYSTRTYSATPRQEQCLAGCFAYGVMRLSPMMLWARCLNQYVSLYNPIAQSGFNLFCSYKKSSASDFILILKAELLLIQCSI